tara:strand:- start:56 stop:418 length:363 start_codon:yes stop_codon:yes gene_type:complete
LYIKLLKSKIHRATITETDLEYEGSITIDSTLMNESKIYNYEKVHVLNITNGNRFETYAIPGKANSGEICVNGAAAHLVDLGDKIIIVSYCQIASDKRSAFFPSIILVDENNRVSKKIDK